MKRKIFWLFTTLALLFSMTGCMSKHEKKVLKIDPLKKEYASINSFIKSINWKYSGDELEKAGYSKTTFPDEGYDSEYRLDDIVIDTLGTVEKSHISVSFKFKSDKLKDVELYYLANDKNDYKEKFEIIYSELEKTQKFKEHFFFVRENKNDKGSIGKLEKTDSAVEKNSDLADIAGVYYEGFIYKAFFTSKDARYKTSQLVGTGAKIKNDGVGFSIIYNIANDNSYSNK